MIDTRLALASPQAVASYAQPPQEAASQGPQDTVQLGGAAEPSAGIYNPRMIADVGALPPGATPLSPSELKQEQETVQEIRRQAPAAGRNYRQEGGPKGPYGPTGVTMYGNSQNGQVQMRGTGTISDGAQMDGTRTRQDNYNHLDEVGSTPAGTVHVSVSKGFNDPARTEPFVAGGGDAAEVNVLAPDGKSGYRIHTQVQNVNGVLQQLPAAAGGQG